MTCGNGCARRPSPSARISATAARARSSSSSTADRGEFYFLEVNARIQVEHPVTEAITGLDIVAEQIAIAEGRPLRLRQEDVTFAGHAIECRINAEDPAHDFRPSPGTISRAVFPVGAAGRNPGCDQDARGAAGEAGEGGGRAAGYVRVDTHVQAGATVPPYYDSLLAKVIAYGADRADALATLADALDRCAVDGVTTNLGMQQAIIADPAFAAGGIDTGYWPGGCAPMAEIRLVDVSLRDGNQSLWGATGLRTAHIATIAPLLGRAGFRALDYSSSTAMGVSVRTHREDPWALLRLTRAAMPDTLLQFIGTGFRFISWERAHPEVIQLVYSALVRNGMDRFVVLDPTHDMDAARATAAIAKKAGAREVIGALTYTISAVHDDAFYAGVAAAYADCPDIDRAYIKDPAGILTPDRARTLIPAVQAALRGRTDNDTGKALELHSHASLGLSPLTCLVAAELGVPVLQVGCGALGNGTSLPDAEDLVANLRASGHTVDIDDRLLAAVARYFDRLAGAEGLPRGEHRGFDAAFMDHQLAGGVMSTTRRQLAELGLEDRFDALMAEISLVRAELGYPIMVTPFPQMVIGQALANLLSAGAVGGARYDTVPDQVIRYVLGTFGKPTAPVEPWVLDRVLNRPRAAELASEPEPLDVAALRKRFGMKISDEELVLRFGLPGAEVDAMIAAGPAVTHYNPDLVPVLKLLRELGERPAPRELTVEKPGFRLSLRGNGR